jgi:hypothetical protein
MNGKREARVVAPLGQAADFSLDRPLIEPLRLYCLAENQTIWIDALGCDGITE